MLPLIQLLQSCQKLCFKPSIHVYTITSSALFCFALDIETIKTKRWRRIRFLHFINLQIKKTTKRMQIGLCSSANYFGSGSILFTLLISGQAQPTCRLCLPLLKIEQGVFIKCVKCIRHAFYFNFSDIRKYNLWYQIISLNFWYLNPFSDVKKF